MDPKRVPRLSLDLLRGFRAAARHLSFTRAARELFVSQPAISREVKTLEDQLGKPLFRRVKGALELTEAGQELYRAADEALGIVDAAALRVAGSLRALSVTTTVALASTWLVPRSRRFAQLHPEIDMRFVASNDMVDLEREHLDVAIRFVLAGTIAPSSDKLFDYQQFPVCAPALTRDRQRPLRVPADLANHVLLDFETVVYGRPWFDWQMWFDAMKLRRVRSAGWLRFSHYDQVIAAAIEGSGVAVGKRPHLTQHLSDGVLVAPLGEQAVATLGGFYIEVARSAQTDAVATFVDWLHAEADRDANGVAQASTRRVRSRTVSRTFNRKGRE
jgi:LysR family transcriptional regulator, glycine cleavage system transcriptional activator